LQYDYEQYEQYEQYKHLFSDEFSDEPERAAARNTISSTRSHIVRTPS
jgi:hypothetical protein